MLPSTPLPCQVSASTTGFLKPIRLVNFLRYRVHTGRMKIMLTGVEKERNRSYSSKMGTKSTSPMVTHLKAESPQEVMTSSKC